MIVPDDYRFPIPWWSPTGRTFANYSGDATYMPPGATVTHRYSALDVAEEEIKGKLPAESEERLWARERRASERMRELLWLDKLVADWLGLDADAEPERRG